jgi:hypothetical protein
MMGGNLGAAVQMLKVINQQGGGSQSWESYWASLISATVENAATTHVVLTFPSAKTELTDTDFTVTVNGVARTVSSASWADAVLTLVLASDVIVGDVVVATFVKNGGTTNVTNNVGDVDLKLYIALLTTPISSAQRIKLDTFLKNYKTAKIITNLSEEYDIMYYLGNETAESSLRNLVKRSHDAVAVNSPTFTPYEGFAGDGISSYLNTNYNPSASGSNYTLNNASLGIYSRTDANALYGEIGSRTSTDDYIAILSRNGGVTYMRLHSGVNPAIQDAEANSLGMFIVCRNAASEEGLFGYHNKSALSRLGIANTNNIPNCNIFIGARNNNGTM